MKDFKTCMKGLWRMAKPVLGRDLVTILIGMVRICASLSFVWICKRLVDIATGVVDADLGKHVWMMIGIILTQIVCGLASNYWGSYNSVKTRNQLRLGLFAHVLNSRWNGRETFRSGDTINRLEEDIRVLTDLICGSLPDVIITVCQLIAASVYLLTMAPSLLWVLIILMAAAVIGSKMYFKKIRQLTSTIRALDSEVQQLEQENLQNRVLVLTLFGVGNIVSRLSGLQTKITKNTITRLNYNAIARGFMNVGFMGGYASAFLWGIFGIQSGAVTYGMMTAFLQLVGRVQGPIASLSGQIPAFIRALTSIERLMDLAELEEEPKGENIHLPGAPEVVVSNLTYAYPGAVRSVLKNFSCRFEKGTFSVLSGPTGIGKSTLIKLILGLLEPTKGSVTVAGHPAGSTIRCNFMYVPQGNSLLSGTIRSNLLLAAPEATEEQIQEVLSLAKCDFVNDLHDGLETRCGEIGSGLSEGQAQRIAIARGLLHSGGILVLDEATSAIDPATEERLLQNLSARFHGRKTILFISHREAVTSAADAVLNIGAPEA